MIVRTLSDVIGDARRHARGPGWESRRIILKADGMGHSLHDTIVKEGAELHLHYKHHFETNYCVAGEGEVLDVRTGERHAIRPGTLYALDRHDEHVLRATKGDLRLICVFTPPLSGLETHRADGSFPPDDAARAEPS
ncbi:MAG TPA: ectoine synthase [Alphaproteobacteria bacterium]|nr:ectoine synthase [Alphaproteobacteria bacterium]